MHSFRAWSRPACSWACRAVAPARAQGRAACTSEGTSRGSLPAARLPLMCVSVALAWPNSSTRRAIAVRLSRKYAKPHERCRCIVNRNPRFLAIVNGWEAGREGTSVQYFGPCTDHDLPILVTYSHIWSREYATFTYGHVWSHRVVALRCHTSSMEADRTGPDITSPLYRVSLLLVTCCCVMGGCKA